MQNHCFSLLNAQTCFSPSCCWNKQRLRSSKDDFDDCERIVWLYNFAFLQSFPNYAIASQYAFAKWVVIILKFNWDQRLTEKKANICLPVQAIERRGKGENGYKMYKM